MKYRIVTGPKGGTDWIYYMIPEKGKVKIYETIDGMNQLLDRLAGLRAASQDLFWIPLAEPPGGFPHPEEAKLVPATDYLSGVLSGNEETWIKERLMILRAAAPYVAGLSLGEVFVSLDADHTVKFGSQQVHLKWRIERNGRSLMGVSFKSRMQGKWKKSELERLQFQIKQAVEASFENGQFEPNF